MSNRSLEDVLSETRAAAAAQRAQMSRQKRADQRAQDREQIHLGQIKLDENETITRELSKLQREFPDWETNELLKTKVEELKALLAANTEELEALGSDKAGVAMFNNRVAAFGTWTKGEGDQNILTVKVSDVRSYSRALHELLESTDHETIDESIWDPQTRVAELRKDVDSQIDFLRGKKRTVDEELLAAQNQLAGLDPATLVNEMQLFELVPYLRKQIVRCKCPFQGCNKVTHSVTRNGEVKEFTGRLFRFKNYVRSRALRSATYMIHKSWEHISELRNAVREELDSWREKATLSSVRDVLRREPAEGIFVGQVEGDFGPEGNRMTFKGEVVLESLSEGVTLRAAHGPIANKLGAMEDGQWQSFINRLWPSGERIHPKLWNLRDAGTPANRTRVLAIATDPNFQAPTLGDVLAIAPIERSERRGEARRKDNRYRNSERLDGLRRGRRGREDED